MTFFETAHIPATAETDPAIGLISTLLVVAILIAKDMVMAVPDDAGENAGKVIDVALAPLALVFAAIITLKVLG